jgi:hypothetical protein
MTEYNIVRFYTVHPDDTTLDGRKETSAHHHTITSSQLHLLPLQLLGPLYLPVSLYLPGPLRHYLLEL